MKKSILLAAAALAVLAGCKPETGGGGMGGATKAEISFTTRTFAFTKATESALESGDAVRIIAGAPVNASSAATVTTGGKLTLATPLYWGVGQTQQTTFAAMYPDNGLDATSYDYDMLAFGSYDYAYQSTFLTAVKTAAPGETVALNFKHPFSKLVISVTNQLSGDAIASVKVKDVVVAGKLDILTETVDVTGKDAVTIDAAKISADGEPLQYGAIVMPQKSQPSIVVTTTQGSVYNYVLDSEFTFVKGTAYSAAITVKSSSGSGDNTGDAVVFSFEVTPWTNATENPTFGEGTQTIGANYWCATGCLYDEDATVEAWNVEFPMTYLGEDKWTVTLNYDESMAADDGSKGFKLHKLDGVDNNWGTQLGFWGNSSTDFVLTSGDSAYGLAAPDCHYWDDVAGAEVYPGNRNIRMAETGKYKIDLDGANLTVTKL